MASRRITPRRTDPWRPFALILSLALLGGVVAGCAQPARGAKMAVAAPSDAAVPANPRLETGIYVEPVAGGEETNPLWKSEVGNAAFRQALIQSLSQSGLLASAPEDGAYTLDARLVSLNQPVAGLDLTVTAVVAYAVTETHTGRAFLTETITTPFTARFADELYGVARFRLANEGAVRANIREFLRRLRLQPPPGPPSAAPTS